MIHDGGENMISRIYDPHYVSACFFRSTVQPPKMKVMVQITEKCNLRCAHCFAEANCNGNEMALHSIREVLIPQFIRNQVVKVTLTGGEPLVHPHIKEITASLLENGIGVSICTNGTLIDPEWVKLLSQYDNVHFNVSLDGMTMQSHGKFRGIKSEAEFFTLKQNISLLGAYGLLNGILTTPNKYATINEYVDLCKFAKTVGAKYVLMNPLSPFGRGTKTQPLAYSIDEMNSLRDATSMLISKEFEIVYIRFPNSERRAIGECPLGAVPYDFCNGDITACPYMVFAADSSELYQVSDFIVGNVFEGADIARGVYDYVLNCTTNKDKANENCNKCSRGCYAIKISNNQTLTDCDYDMCPINGG